MNKGRGNIMGENYRWQQVLQGINYVLHKSEGFICAVLIAVVTTMTCWQVVSRYILYIPSSWVDETARYLYVWSAYIGGAYLGYGTKEHIYIDIVTMFYKNKPNASKIDATFDRITALCLLIFGGFFSKIYLDFLVTYITYPSSSPALNINILYPM